MKLKLTQTMFLALVHIAEHGGEAIDGNRSLTRPTSAALYKRGYIERAGCGVMFLFERWRLTDGGREAIAWARQNPADVVKR